MARIIDDNIKRQLSKRMDFFLKYFPVRVRNVGEDAVAARQLIWDFKDSRNNAFDKVAQMTATHLIQVCGERIKDIVFVRALKKVPNFKLHSLFLNFNSCPRSISSFKSEILFWTGI